MKTETEKMIFDAIERHNMLATGKNITVAVSGGADSMCLLHFFNKYSRELCINIQCAHVNHLIRGAQAYEDERFVEKYCREHSIEFSCARFDVPKIARESGESVEECARRLRYEYFSSLGEDRLTATAHNLNDCAETMLFNLIRGTGLDGLCSIPPVRGSVIRPLIHLSRDRIERYCAEQGIEYVTDKTNESLAYSRNKVRHLILPVCGEINSNYLRSLALCMETLSDVRDYIGKSADEAYSLVSCGEGLSADALKRLHPTIKSAVLLRFCRDCGGKDVSSRHIRLIEETLSLGGAVMLPGGVTVECVSGILRKRAAERAYGEIFMPITREGTYSFEACDITLTVIDKSLLRDYNKPEPQPLYAMDAQAAVGACFRSRREGDRFRYPNAPHSKSLKNLFKEKGITARQRAGVPFIASENGVLWIDGAGVSDAAKITAETKKALLIELKRK